MEGAGERVVVFGLDSGVAITLVNKPEHRRRHCFSSKSPTRLVHSSVETNTDRLYHDSAVQIDGCRINDNYYADYITPTSRLEYSQRSPVISRMFHNTDAFAESLRKYPMISNLEKSQSAEIVQRILNYAQGRSFGKRSKSKSMRSLLRRCSTHRHVSRRNRKCVGVGELAPNEWRDSDVDFDNRLDDLDLRYNYLNAAMSKPAIEVRYLTGVKRAICDKIRDLCEDTPKVCPRMQSRYSHHKKHCHQSAASVGFAPERKSKNDMEIQASQSSEPREINLTRATSPYLLEKASKSCFCHTPRQCVCKTNQTTEEEQETTQAMEEELIKMYPELAYTLDAPTLVNKDLPTLVEEEVAGWVNNILPFYNINLLDENEKNQLIDNLVRALHDIERTDSVEAKEKIQKCLQSLPMLRNYVNRDEIIQELSDNLVKKLRYVVVQKKVEEGVDRAVDEMLAKSNLSDKQKDMIKKAVVHKLKPMVLNKALPDLKDLDDFLKEEVVEIVEKLPLKKKDLGSEFEHRASLALQRRKSRAAKAPGMPGSQGMPGMPGGEGMEGVPGMEGRPGMPGISGMRGMSGLPGVEGMHGMAGMPGVSGMPGMAGMPGMEGLHGMAGMPGVSGMPGMPGMPGMEGLHGRAGMPGVSGMPGMAGMPGMEGMHGRTGMPGLSGISGMPGMHGKAGLSGVPGISGMPGMEGMHGMAGVPGVSGVPGMEGTSGTPGLSGRSGRAGILGKSGTPGTEGIRGLSGMSGRSGMPGVQGWEGMPGRPGLEGVPDMAEKMSGVSRRSRKSTIPGIPGMPGGPGMPGMPRGSRKSMMTGKPGVLKAPLTFEEKEEAVLDWVEALPELADIPLAERKKLIAPLVESLAKEKKPEKMKSIIKNWINDVVNKGDRRISPRTMNKLSKRLVKRLLPAESATDDTQSQFDQPSEKQDTIDTVTSWFEDIPELHFKNTPENRRAVQDLATKINDIKEQFSNLDIAQAETRKEVSNWLKDMLKKNKIYLHPSTVDNLVNKLVNNLQTGKPGRSQKAEQRKQQIGKDIWKWLSSLPYVDEKDYDKYKGYIEKLAENLQDIERNNYSDQTLQNKLNDEVNTWLTDLSDNTGLEIYEADKNKLIKNVANDIKSAPKGRKKWHKTKTLKKGIQDAVSSVLNRYPSSVINKENILSDITNLLQKDLKSDKSDPNKTRAQIIKHLEKNTKLPPKAIKEIADDIMHNIKRISDTGLFQEQGRGPYKKSYALGHREPEDDVSDSKSDEISREDYDEEYDSYDELEPGRGRRPGGRRLSVDSDEGDEEDMPELRRERSLSNIPRDEDLDDEAERKFRKGFLTSTPKRDTSVDSEASISPVGEKSYKSRRKSKGEIEEDKRKVHKQNVKNALQDFLQDLKIDEDTKNKIIDELADDIIDRQKYLEISNGRQSSTAELEHLKFQIFKRLNNVIGDKEMSKFMNNIKTLKARLDTLDPMEPDKSQKKAELKSMYEKEPEESRDKKYVSEPTDKFGRKVETDDTLSYKDQLRHVISQTIPGSPDDESFEMLKQNLAEAFVSLHYSSADEEAKNRLKKLIYDEINQYCQDYIRRYPESALDPKKLNRDLYSALMKVPPPDKESLEPSHEISKIQEEIKRWLGEISTDKSVLKSINVRNNISVLATHLYDIQEKHKHQPGVNVKEEMMRAILEWLQQFPVKGQKIDVKNDANILLNSIANRKRPERSRQSPQRFSLSTGGTDGHESIKINIESRNESASARRRSSDGTQYAPFLPPPSTLSAEDRAHLDMIRARSPLYGRKETPTTQLRIRKDASSDPPPVNISTQTDIDITTIHDDQYETPGTQPIQAPHTNIPEATAINIDASPQVVVKEYLWDSSDSRQGSIEYSPRNTAGTIPTRNADRPINVISHNEYIQPSGENQPNVISQSTKVTTQQDVTQQQDQLRYPQKPRQHDRSQIVHEKISQTRIEQRGYYTNVPYEKYRGSHRPLLSGYLSPAEQERLRRDRYLVRDEDFDPFIEDEARRMFMRHDKYEPRRPRCCRCGGRIMAKCRSPRPNCHRHDDLKMCPKCFGTCCPHPTRLYFNSDF